MDKISNRETHYIYMFLAIIIIPILSRFSDAFVLVFSSVLFLYNLTLAKDKSKCKKSSLYKILILYFLILTIILVVSFRSAKDVLRIIQFFCCFSVFEYFVATDSLQSNINSLAKPMKCILVISLILWVSNGFTGAFRSMYTHFNKFGFICMITMALLILNDDKKVKKSNGVFIFISLVLMYFSSRSALLGAIAFIIVYLTGTIFKNSKKIYYIIGISTAIILTWFIIVYPTLYGTQLGHELEMLSRQYLHKNFFSGRQVVWNMIFDYMKDKKIWGCGLSVVPQDIYDTTLSCHNLYLQTYLQGGIVNLFGLIVILADVFMIACKSKNHSKKPKLVATIVMICVHECFEVVLMQNQMSLMIISWILIAIVVKISEENGESEVSEKQ